MILVQLGVQRADLPLPIGIVQRVVDGGGRNAQAGGRDPVDHQRSRQAAGLLVGGDILELR